MKKLIYAAIFACTSTAAHAQISIGGKSAIEGTKTLLDFNSDVNGNKVVGTGANTNGIILPPVTTLPSYTIVTGQSSPNNGTFLLDKSDQKVKMFENNAWVELSGPGNTGQIANNTSNDSTVNTGVIMGAQATNAIGVLVLESADKAMILPRIANPHTNVKNPYPGMLCYDTVGKALAVYDGTNWNYWK